MLYSCSLGLEFLDLARLVPGQHIGEYNVNPETLRDALRRALIAGRCGNVFDLLGRRSRPLAIMPSAKTGPHQKHAL